MALNDTAIKQAIQRARNGSLKDLEGVLSAFADGDALYVGGSAVTASAAELNRAADDGQRAVVPTADGLTTGLLLTTDNTVVATSANSAHYLTLPAIASVPLGWSVKIFLGSTACKLATVATSNTKINNGDSDGTALTTLPASSYTLVTKTLADNFVAECYVAAGTRTIPTPA